MSPFLKVIIIYINFDSLSTSSTFWLTTRSLFCFPFAMSHAWDVSCLEERVMQNGVRVPNFEALPACSWEEFCGVVGIQDPEYAQTLMCTLARHHGQSRSCDLPSDVLTKATEAGKDPYVYWVRLITPQFRGETDDMPMKVGDPRDPMSYYLVHVMVKECKDEEKDWTDIAESMIADRELYAEVKRRVAMKPLSS